MYELILLIPAIPGTLPDQYICLPQQLSFIVPWPVKLVPCSVRSYSTDSQATWIKSAVNRQTCRSPSRFGPFNGRVRLRVIRTWCELTGRFCIDTAQPGDQSRSRSWDSFCAAAEAEREGRAWDPSTVTVALLATPALPLVDYADCRLPRCGSPPPRTTGTSPVRMVVWL